MGHEAIKEDETTEETTEEITTTEPVEEEVISEVVKDDTAEETDEVEIIREDSQSHTGNEFHGIQKRVNKLNEKVDAATGAQTQAEQSLALEQEKNRLLQMQIEQTQQAPAIPNPEDFDEGVSDPKYQQQLVTYNQSVIQAEVQRQVAATTQQSQTTATVDAQSQSLIRQQTAHYEKVKDLKVKNYLDREDKALEILGNDAVNYIIRKIPDAHNMLYYLGTDGETNRRDAERLAHLAQTDAETLLLELGGLNAALKVKPKSKSKQAPDPDEEINGDVSTKKRRKGPTFE